MDDIIKKYIKELFSNSNEPINPELEEELYSNMLAKKKDLMDKGISEKKANELVKESLPSLHGVIGEKKQIDLNGFKLECTQTAFLFAIIAWIFSIPLIVFKSFAVFSILAFLIVVFFGGLFFYKQSKHEKPMYNEMKNERYIRYRKIAWIVWSLLILVWYLGVSAVIFGSDIWFSRPLLIHGPYELLTVVVNYYIPLLTVFVPVTIGTFPKIFSKYERRTEDET